MALRKQLEKTLLQIPPPKPPPAEWAFIPNLNSAEFMTLVGFEKVVNALSIKETSKGKVPPLTEKAHQENPKVCGQCGTDFTPCWKTKSKEGADVLMCEKCSTVNVKKELKTEHTARLKAAFLKALKQEQEIEQKLSESTPIAPKPQSSKSSSSSRHHLISHHQGVFIEVKACYLDPKTGFFVYHAAWSPPNAVELVVTLYKDSAGNFKKKDYFFVIETHVPDAERKKLAIFSCNMADFACLDTNEFDLEMEFKPQSKKVGLAKLGAKIKCEFVKQGSAYDDDMESNFSHISETEFKQRINELTDFSDDEDDIKQDNNKKNKRQSWNRFVDDMKTMEYQEYHLAMVGNPLAESLEDDSTQEKPPGTASTTTCSNNNTNEPPAVIINDVEEENTTSLLVLSEQTRMRKTRVLSALFEEEEEENEDDSPLSPVPSSPIPEEKKNGAN
ncbi:hypothetical protein QZH41_000449 [Actinostola sp. cb2023]|nr:hypothetical protein QZH41_000449 [Actinostola sp. cb2023]